MDRPGRGARLQEAVLLRLGIFLAPAEGHRGGGVRERNPAEGAARLEIVPQLRPIAFVLRGVSHIRHVDPDGRSKLYRFFEFMDCFIRLISEREGASEGAMGFRVFWREARSFASFAHGCGHIIFLKKSDRQIHMRLSERWIDVKRGAEM